MKYVTIRILKCLSVMLTERAVFCSASLRRRSLHALNVLREEIIFTE